MAGRVAAELELARQTPPRPHGHRGGAIEHRALSSVETGLVPRVVTRPEGLPVRWREARRGSRRRGGGGGGGAQNERDGGVDSAPTSDGHSRRLEGLQIIEEWVFYDKNDGKKIGGTTVGYEIAVRWLMVTVGAGQYRVTDALSVQLPDCDEIVDKMYSDLWIRYRVQTDAERRLLFAQFTNRPGNCGSGPINGQTPMICEIRSQMIEVDGVTVHIEKQ
ncbi:hypothetical protein ASPZODRAFT_754842 [Penicilliopsis zonata CBS 506.65]|uniref:Uncharacterized protein n=1 Tax=Penicilliopsis zonata CBS 506.65 TaxID=1073090 RepID=A0A1L9SAS9_9EURO|nr:hypothetical protein ASPZODRAFT_754842 [Penicilliopsis zonata CBS 506.65]OJJ44251.1 hypothetical protein ASPZODRAFT_754842 [Penicilliopsis zonata CBS 506.65]